MNIVSFTSDTIDVKTPHPDEIARKGAIPSDALGVTPPPSPPVPCDKKGQDSAESDGDSQGRGA